MDANQTINELGGTVAVAALCEVTPGAISQWRTNGIPKSWAKYLAIEIEDRRKKSQKKRSRK